MEGKLVKERDHRLRSEIADQTCLISRSADVSNQPNTSDQLNNSPCLELRFLVRAEVGLLFVVWLLFVSVFGMVFSVATLPRRPLSSGLAVAGVVVIMAVIQCL